MPSYESIQELVSCAQDAGTSLSRIIWEDQAQESGLPMEQVFLTMKERLLIMKQSVQSGIRSEARSISGLSGGAAVKMRAAAESGKSLLGKPFGMLIARALAVSETNACMGKIVASPTAGSCGIIPAALLSIMEERGYSDDDAALALFTSAGLGLVVANRANVSGAQGGCQAECGSATAMAAAALAELAGGTPSMAANAFALALKNMLGLVCDPVAGLVEIPCIKRNAMGAVMAVAAADMALSGIESAIPADEVIDAMGAIGDSMPASLKETSKGGLAATPTGIKLTKLCHLQEIK